MKFEKHIKLKIHHLNIRLSFNWINYNKKWKNGKRFAQIVGLIKYQEKDFMKQLAMNVMVEVI